MTETPVQGNAGSAMLEWRGECCIDSLETLRQLLLNALDAKTSVELDLSGVTRIDTAGLQLLLAFVVEMQRQNRQLLLQRPSETFSQSARFAGLTAMFGLV